MKKKISIIACAIVMLVMSVFATGCSCYNKRIFDFNYKYTYCLIKEGDVWNEYRVKSWDDYDDGTISIWTEDGQMIYTHCENVIMYGEH